MLQTRKTANPFPGWVRWTALIWLAVWLTIYLKFWGASTFLFLCDIAVILTCIGLFTGSALLISSQTVSSIVIDTAWLLDIATKLIFNRHLIGGTDYFFDPNYPLWVRLMSCFHVVLPFVLIAALRRTGYDRRALKLQIAIAAVAIIASRLRQRRAKHKFRPRRSISAPPMGPSSSTRGSRARRLNRAHLHPHAHRTLAPISFAPRHLRNAIVDGA